MADIWDQAAAAAADTSAPAPSGDIWDQAAASPGPPVMPRVGQRLAPPGTALRRKQNAAAAQLPPDQQPGARMANVLTGSIPLAAGVGASMALGPEAGIPAATATAALGAGVGSLVKQGIRATTGSNEAPGNLTDAAKGAASDAITQGALPELGGRAMGWVGGKIAGALPDSWRAAIGLKPTPDPAMVARKPGVDPIPIAHQALAPVPTDLDFPDDTARALPLVRAAEDSLGRPIGQAAPGAGIGAPGSRPGDAARDIQAATKIAKQAAFGRSQMAAGPYLESQVSANPVADQLESLITPGMRKEDAARVAQIEAEAAQYRGQVYTVEESMERAAAHNAQLRAFYKAPDDAARAQLAATADPIILKAKADGFRKMMYQPFQDAIDSAATPAEKQIATDRLNQFLDARGDYGALDSFLENVERRINPASREQPPSLIGQLLKGGRAAFQATHGSLASAHSTIGQLGNQNIDALLTQMMDATTPRYPEATLNLPYPRPTINNPMPQPRITSGAVRMGATPDASGAIDPTLPQTYQLGPGRMTAGQAPPSRQLPSVPMQMPGAPDTSGPIPNGGPQPGMGMVDDSGPIPGGQRKLPAAPAPRQIQPGRPRGILSAPVKLNPRELPGANYEMPPEGAGMTANPATEMIPIRDPTTGMWMWVEKVRSAPSPDNMFLNSPEQ